jgi:CCR4-NOT complex subunit CAF16
MLGLLQPFKVLLIDEFTVDLDVLARRDLLDYLKRETVERGSTILYCTHIFDGMDDWPTHSIFMAEGRIQNLLSHPLPRPLYQMALDFMLESRQRTDNSNQANAEPLIEEFGGQGFSAGRIMPSTQYFQKNRMNDYRF